MVTAAIAITALLTLLHVPVHAKAMQKQTTSYFNDMREGFTYIQSHAYVKTFFVFCAFFFILAAPVAFLTPLQVTRTFGDDVWRLTAIEWLLMGTGLLMFLRGFFLVGSKVLVEAGRPSSPEVNS